MSARCWLVVWAALVWATPVQAGGVWLHGTNAWGGGGIYRVDSALAATPGELVVAASLAGFSGSGFFAPGDSDSGLDAGIHVSWTPLVGLQVGLGGSYVLNTYTTFASSMLQAVGNPEAHVKAGVELAPGYAVGVAAHAAMSTYSKSALSTWPVVARFMLLGAAQPLSFLQVNAQAGYALDRSAAAFSGAPEDPVRLALGISNRPHVDFGVGVVGRIRALFLAPFVEFSGALPVGAAQPRWTGRVTPGLRLDRSYGGILEVGVGVDLRVAGTPAVGNTLAGAPPWRAFLLFAVHGLTEQAGRVEWSQEDCQQDSDCPSVAMCQHNLCVQRPPPPLPAAPQQAAPVLHGLVLDSSTHKPVPQARIVLQDYPQAPLRVGPDGSFTSFPLPRDGAPVDGVVRAYGYLDQRLHVQDLQPAVQVNLQPEPKASTGSMHVFVRDGRSGAVVAGARVAVGGKTIATDAQGECVVQLQPGLVHVVTNADRYVSQNSQIEIQVGSTVILNIDLTPLHHVAHPRHR